MKLRKFGDNAPEPATAQSASALLLNSVRQGIRTARHIYGHTQDTEARVWLEEWTLDACAVVSRVTGEEVRQQ